MWGLGINTRATDTILTQVMADEFNFLWSQIQNYIADADAILALGQLELHEQRLFYANKAKTEMRHFV